MRTLKREERCKYEVAQELGLLPNGIADQDVWQALVA